MFLGFIVFTRIYWLMGLIPQKKALGVESGLKKPRELLKKKPSPYVNWRELLWNTPYPFAVYVVCEWPLMSYYFTDPLG